ncbi:MAG: hypothetical protein R2828_16190 [Saprospiraceae bacterium]
MKNAQVYYWAIVLAFSFGLYIHKYYLDSPPLENKNTHFEIPGIGQNLLRQPLQLHTRDTISMNSTRMMGKYPFTAYIYIDDVPPELPEDDFIIPDGGWWDNEAAYFPTDGLQLKLDSNLIIKGAYSDNDKAHIPVFIVNETNSVKYLLGTHDFLLAMMEAKDQNGVWRPIEMPGFFGCLNGVGFIKVHPKEFCVITFPLFRGKFETQLRVKVKNNHSILVSAPFPGSINEGQFKFGPNDRIKTYIEEDLSTRMHSWFWDSVPLEFSKH